MPLIWDLGFAEYTRLQPPPCLLISPLRFPLAIMATQMSKKKKVAFSPRTPSLNPRCIHFIFCWSRLFFWFQFVADGVFFAELNEVLTRELAEDGYSGVEVRVTPMRTEIIIRATRTQNVLGKLSYLGISIVYSYRWSVFWLLLEWIWFRRWERKED